MTTQEQHERADALCTPSDRDGLLAWRFWWIALVLSWVFYRLTMAPGVLWGDAGHAQLHTALDGWLVEGQIARSHMLYFMLTRGLHRLFDVEAAVAANLVSTIGGALTVANVAYLGAVLCRCRWAAAGGALLMLFAHTHWRLSVSAEVVTLSTALLSAELICMTRLTQTGRLRWLIRAMLCNGLGLANHNFALLMWPVYAVLALRYRGQIRRVHALPAAAALLALLVGASPLLALGYADWRSHGQLGDTLQSWLVGSYTGKVVNIAQLPRLLAQTVAYTLLNFPTPLLLLVPAGLRALFRTAPPAVGWMLGGAFFVYLMFGARYDVPDQYTFLVPAFLFLALFTTLGMDSLLRRRAFVSWRAVVLLATALAPVVYAALPPIARRLPFAAGFLPRRDVPHRDRYEWFLQPWLRGYDGAERFARETLEALPPWAVLVVDSTLAAPINYVQFTQRLRRDVRLDCWAARQDWLAAVDWPRERQAAIRAQRLYATSDDPKYQAPWLREGSFTLHREGLLFRVSAQPARPAATLREDPPP